MRFWLQFPEVALEISFLIICFLLLFAFLLFLFVLLLFLSMGASCLFISPLSQTLYSIFFHFVSAHLGLSLFPFISSSPPSAFLSSLFPSLNPSCSLPTCLFFPLCSTCFCHYLLPLSLTISTSCSISFQSFSLFFHWPSWKSLSCLTASKKYSFFSQ